MTKQIPGVIQAKTKLLSPIFPYEIDTGKGKLQYVDANRVDQVGDALIFMIEYSEYNVFVAGFAKWKSYRIKKTEGKEVLEKVLKVRAKKSV